MTVKLVRRYFAMEPDSKFQQDIINRKFRRTGVEQFTNATHAVGTSDRL